MFNILLYFVPSVPIVVGFENATYTGSESDEMVQLSIVVTDPPLEGAPRPFSLSLSTDEGFVITIHNFTIVTIL